MSVLSELYSIFSAMQIPVETGVFSGKAPDEYVVLIPLADTFELHADNLPRFEIQEARLSLFTKNSYLRLKNTVTKALLAAGLTITDRRYIGYEDDTGFHHYAIDAAKEYPVKED